METKWIAIMAIGMFAAMFVGVSIESYSKSQCRIAYAQSGRSAEDIAKVCK